MDGEAGGDGELDRADRRHHRGIGREVGEGHQQRAGDGTAGPPIVAAEREAKRRGAGAERDHGNVHALDERHARIDDGGELLGRDACHAPLSRSSWRFQIFVAGRLAEARE
jgi:hypothetical protein